MLNLELLLNGSITGGRKGVHYCSQRIHFCYYHIFFIIYDHY